MRGVGWLRTTKLRDLFGNTFDVPLFCEVLQTQKDMSQELSIGVQVMDSRKSWTSLESCTLEEVFQTLPDAPKSSASSAFTDEQKKSGLVTSEAGENATNDDILSTTQNRRATSSCKLSRPNMISRNLTRYSHFFVALRSYAELGLLYGFLPGNNQNVLRGIQTRTNVHHFVPNYWVSWAEVLKASEREKDQSRIIHIHVNILGWRRILDVLYDEVQFSVRKDETSKFYVRRYPARKYPHPCMISFESEVYDSMVIIKLAFSLPSTFVPERICVQEVFPSLRPRLTQNPSLEKKLPSSRDLRLRELVRMFPFFFASSFQSGTGETLYRSLVRDKYPLLQLFRCTKTKEAEENFTEILLDPAQRELKEELYDMVSNSINDSRMIVLERRHYYSKKVRVDAKELSEDELLQLSLEVLPEEDQKGFSLYEILGAIEKKYGLVTVNTFHLNLKRKYHVSERFFKSYPYLFTCETKENHHDPPGRLFSVRKITPKSYAQETLSSILAPSDAISHTSYRDDGIEDKISGRRKTSPERPQREVSERSLLEKPRSTEYFTDSISPALDMAIVENLEQLLQLRGPVHVQFAFIKLPSELREALVKYYTTMRKFVNNHPFHFLIEYDRLYKAQDKSLF